MLGTALAGLAAASALRPSDNVTSESELTAGSVIMVTGERVRRSEFDTPASVEVFDQQRIEGFVGVDRIEQILELIPNFQLSSGGEGPTIRGQDTTGPTRDLPAFLGGTRPRTTLIVDGRPVSFNEFVFGSAPLWDVDQVEVFRSPQTTTQGQNSIAGAIFVQTSDPSFEPQTRARVIVGNLGTRQASFSATGPIDRDVAIRVAADLRYSHPASKIADRVEGADPNHDVYGLVRGKLLANLSDSVRFELSLSHSKSQMPQLEAVRPPFKLREDPGASYGTFKIGVDSGTASLTADLSPSLTLKTLFTGGRTGIRRFAPPGLGTTRIAGRDWSGETLFTWDPSETLQATMGLSHRQATLHQMIDLSQLSGIGRFDDTQRATGIFGEATWLWTSRLHFTAGLRYQSDRQVRTGALAGSTSPIPLNYRKAFDAWLPKLSLSYDVQKNVRVGVLLQRAYNPGGTTLRFDTGQPDNFQAEFLWDTEIFARASLAGGKLTASANLFRYDMTNPQRARSIVIITPTSALVTFADLFNVDRARSEGAELSMDWRPDPSFSARLAIGALSTRITGVPPAYAAFDEKEFQRSPHFSLGAEVMWQVVPRLSVSAQVRHNSGYFSDDLNRADRRVQGWTKVDAQASYTAGQFKIFGYARNLLNTFYLTYFLNPSWATAGDPREIGIGFEAKF
ncbi:TonB-dependent receptor [Sphingomonas daechungensis]|uniref:TonB-dependent receptor n=1 Tax=Sphingomonas daechungensis TaxID=1176646 RepID=UPI0037842713